MIKRLIPLCTLLLSSIGFSQSNANLEVLLDRLYDAENSFLPIQFVMEERFKEDEQEILRKHFEKQNAAVLQNESFSSGLFDILYVMNAWNSDGTFGTLPPSPPLTYSEIIDYPDLLFLADDFDDTETLYALNWVFGGDSTLESINVETGEATHIGPLTGMLDNHLPTGLSWDYTTSTMYAMTGSISDSSVQLYTVDLNTGALTTVGGLLNQGGIWLEISNDGTAYTADTVNDLLFELDLETAELTPLGPLGLDLQFAQDASFDHSTNVLYMAAFLSNDENGIYEVDLSTGATTLLGLTSPGLEFAGFSIPEPFVASVSDNEGVQVSVYPNPASDIIHVKVPNSIQVESVEVFDVLGRHTGKTLQGDQLDIADLSTGLYFVSVETLQGKVVKKIIKK